MAGKFELKLSKNNKYFFTLPEGAGQVVLTSEMYETKARCSRTKKSATRRLTCAKSMGRALPSAT